MKIAAVEGGPLSEELREASLRAIMRVLSRSIEKRMDDMMTSEKDGQYRSRFDKFLDARIEKAADEAARSATITAEANGRVLGLREAVRTQLRLVGLPLTKTAAKHIDQCSDEKILLQWQAGALKAKTTADVFASPETARKAASKAPAKPARKLARKSPVAKRRAAEK